MENRIRNITVDIPGYGPIMAQAIVSGREQDVASIKDILSFNEINKTIEGIAATLKPTIDKISPDKASVEFGIALTIESGQLGALLVQGEAAASLKLTLTWGEKK